MYAYVRIYTRVTKYHQFDRPTIVISADLLLHSIRSWPFVLEAIDVTPLAVRERVSTIIMRIMVTRLVD